MVNIVSNGWSSQWFIFNAGWSLKLVNLYQLLIFKNGWSLSVVDLQQWLIVKNGWSLKMNDLKHGWLWAMVDL